MSDDKLELSRRKILGATGAVGAAGAAAGLGTSALFSDEESFENNSITAGELDLFVDYVTTVTQDGVSTGSTTNDGQIQGGVSSEYQIADLKPGDEGFLAFCPKIVDNKGWLFVGSDEGVTDYENGQTEPEGDVDPSGGGTLGSSQTGVGAGELSEAIQVDVEYCEVASGVTDPSGPDNYNTIREFNNPADYTLADLFKELESGFLLDGEPDEDGDDPSGTQEYPSSPDQSTQSGPCLCISWNLPAEVGNEVQSDAVEFDITFAARQWRNNPDPENPFVDYTVGSETDLRSAVSDSSAGDVIALSSDVPLTGDLSLAGQTLVPAMGESPTLAVNGGRLNLGSDSGLCQLNIDLNSGNVMYSPSESTGVTLLSNTITMSPESEHGIRLEGTDIYSDTVIANNVFTQEGPVNVGNAQGVIVSGRNGVTIDSNQFNGYNPSGGSPDYNGQAVLITSQGRDTMDVSVTENSIDYWNNGVFVLENQNEISGVSVTGNGISDTDDTAIVAFDDTGSEGFEDLNGENSESAQETALEQNNSFNNTANNVDVIL